MTIGAIIQARLSSRRVPGKVLLLLNGKAMLEYVVEAVGQVPNLDGIVVATSRESSDDSLAQWCAAHSVLCWRGSLENVAERFLETLEAQGWKAAVRISADSPLLDWRLIEAAVAEFRAGQWDVVSNVWPRTYPHGQSVEVIRASSFRAAYTHFSLPEEFEHVTPYFYAHAADWRIKNIAADQDTSDQSQALDVPEDVIRIERLLKRL